MLPGGRLKASRIYQLTPPPFSFIVPECITSLYINLRTGAIASRSASTSVRQDGRCGMNRYKVVIPRSILANR